MSERVQLDGSRLEDLEPIRPRARSRFHVTAGPPGGAGRACGRLAVRGATKCHTQADQPRAVDVRCRRHSDPRRSGIPRCEGTPRGVGRELCQRCVKSHHRLAKTAQLVPSSPSETVSTIGIVIAPIRKEERGFGRSRYSRAIRESGGVGACNQTAPAGPRGESDGQFRHVSSAQSESRCSRSQRLESRPPRP